MNNSIKDLTQKIANLSVKIILISVFSAVVIGIIMVIYVFTYSKDEATLNITDFSKTTTTTLQPLKWYPYAIASIKIKGYVNDTIKITESYYGDYDILLTGKIDTIKEMEYYGESEIKFTIEPYKATDGELEINLKL